MPAGYRQLMETNLRAYRDYVPKPYPGRVTLFRARTRPLFHSFQADLGWSNWAGGGVEIKTIPGNHVSMLHEPYIRTLGAQLQAALDRVS
jgi:thioesterase domain-containing protein